MQLDICETRTSQERLQDLLKRLPKQIQYAKDHTQYFGQLFAHVHAKEIHTLEQLTTLPVTRKSDLSAQQKDHPPFGGMNAVQLHQMKRIFHSPGPIFEPQGKEIDSFRFARALRAAGFESGDLVHNTFSYHLDRKSVV